MRRVRLDSDRCLSTLRRDCLKNMPRFQTIHICKFSIRPHTLQKHEDKDYNEENETFFLEVCRNDPHPFHLHGYYYNLFIKGENYGRLSSISSHCQ